MCSGNQTLWKTNQCAKKVRKTALLPFKKKKRNACRPSTFSIRSLFQVPSLLHKSSSNLTAFKSFHPLLSHFLYVRKLNNCLIVLGVTFFFFSKLKVSSIEFSRHTAGFVWDVNFGHSSYYVLGLCWKLLIIEGFLPYPILFLSHTIQYNINHHLTSHPLV